MSRLGECFSNVDFKTPVISRKVIPYYPDGAILAANEQSDGQRERTNLRTGSEGLRGVIRRLDPVALAIFWTRAPVVVAPPPTDAKVIAGTILGIAGMAITTSRRHW
jgi:hypothetical protein